MLVYLKKIKIKIKENIKIKDSFTIVYFEFGERIQ